MLSIRLDAEDWSTLAGEARRQGKSLDAFVQGLAQTEARWLIP